MGSQINSSNDQATCYYDSFKFKELEKFKCNSCDRMFAKTCMFGCKSCSSSEPSSSPDSQLRKLCCKICTVVLHIRKKHEVVDDRGYAPAVCVEHDNIYHFFCETCQKILCTECIESHITRSFQPLSQKAVEVRKNVFDLLIENEELSKPTKHQEALVRDCSDIVTNIRESMSIERIKTTFLERCMKFVNSLSTTRLHEFYLKIAEELKEEKENDSSNSAQELTAENIQMIQSAAAKADANGINLREVLQDSDGNLVKNFLENTFRTSVQERRRQKLDHVHLQWTEDTDLFITVTLLALLSTQIPKINTTSAVSIQLKLAQKNNQNRKSN